MASDNIYPWNSEAWQRFQSQVGQNKVPHAILLTGPVGCGKTQFAKQMAGVMLCMSRSAESFICDGCKACRWQKANTHPDFTEIMPDKPGGAIKIDQIRELVDLSLQTSYQHCRVIVIHAADSLNTAAANALLKTLEEPPGKMFVILVAQHSDLLPSTIKSRCQLLPLNLPGAQQSQAWLSQQAVLRALDNTHTLDCLLALAQDSPLILKSLVDNKQLESQKSLLNELLLRLTGGTPIFSIAKKNASDDFVLMLVLLERVLLDIIRLHLGASPRFTAYQKQLEHLKNNVLLIYLFEYVDHIQQLLLVQQKKISLNWQLQLEAVILKIRMGMLN